MREWNQNWKKGGKKDFLVTQNSIDRLQGMSTEKKSFGDQFS